MRRCNLCNFPTTNPHEIRPGVFVCTDCAKIVTPVFVPVYARRFSKVGPIVASKVYQPR